MNPATSLTLYSTADVAPLVMCDVLIIDTDDYGSQSMAEDLASAGKTVRTARNIFQAIRAVQSFQPRIVFIEINLPGWLDGSRLSRQVARLDPDISIVMMSADIVALQKMQHDRGKSVVAIVKKPLPAGHVKRFVQHVCQKKRRDLSGDGYRLVR